MFGMGAPEMLVILVMALIIVGPQKLPELGRTLGRAVNEFKAQSDVLRSAISLDQPSTSVYSVQATQAAVQHARETEDVTALPVHSIVGPYPVETETAAPIVEPQAVAEPVMAGSTTTEKIA